MSERLFTPRFFIMCAYTFTVFVSVFQLLPTAPYHVLDLGGSTTAAGLFLGFLTYSSAVSAPLLASRWKRVPQVAAWDSRPTSWSGYRGGPIHPC